jgi:two-component system, OmpR family, response regulator
MSSLRLLVIEDAEAIRVAVASAARRAGYDVRELPDGRNLDTELSRFPPDVVVLDVMLPGLDGFQLLQRIRSATDCGVVMLTARDAVEDRLRGLTDGADDYLVKPFVMAELLVRVEGLMRRMGRLRPVTTIGDLSIDHAAHRVTRGDAEIGLTATEFQLLTYLAAHPGQALSKTRILTAVWGYDDYDPNLVEVYVSALRRKLGPGILHTVRNSGYLLEHRR